MENNINIVESFCHPDNYDIHPIVSRSTIRELSENAEWAWYENYLHAVRMDMLMLGMEYQEAIDFVKKNDIILVLEAMKMENEIVAPQDGTVASINVNSGATVEAGDVLATLN